MKDYNLLLKILAFGWIARGGKLGRERGGHIPSRHPSAVRLSRVVRCESDADATPIFISSQISLAIWNGNA